MDEERDVMRVPVCLQHTNASALSRYPGEVEPERGGGQKKNILFDSPQNAI